MIDCIPRMNQRPTVHADDMLSLHTCSDDKNFRPVPVSSHVLRILSIVDARA